MNDIASDRVGRMTIPPRRGGITRESVDDVGCNLYQTATNLGRENGTLS